MFMVKNELQNALKLTRAKLGSNYIKLSGIAIAMFIIFVGNFLPTAIRIFSDEAVGVVPYSIMDISMIIFFGLSVAWVVLMLTYRQKSDELAIFPQTNTSRFVSHLLVNYLSVLIAAVVVLVAYLLEYGAFSLIAKQKEHVYLALDFDWGFVLAGFCTFILYSFLAIAVCGLIGAILRKWKLYAAVLLALALWGLVYAAREGNVFLEKGFNFIFMEPSFGVFTVKIIAVWLVITAISLVLNYFTVYYQSGWRPSLIKGVAFGTIGAFIAVGVANFALVANVSYSGAEIISSEPMSDEEYYKDYAQIRIDATSLPKGSHITIEGENIIVPQLLDSYGTNQRTMVVYFPEQLDDLAGEKLLLRYRFPGDTVNGIELTGFGNPRLTAKLDGTVLRIDYTFDNAHVVILPVFGIARQFEAFRDKGLFTSSFMGYSYGGGGGNVMITVE